MVKLKSHGKKFLKRFGVLVALVFGVLVVTGQVAHADTVNKGTITIYQDSKVKGTIVTKYKLTVTYTIGTQTTVTYGPNLRALVSSKKDTSSGVKTLYMDGTNGYVGLQTPSLDNIDATTSGTQKFEGKTKTLFKGSDGFYYEKEGKNQQAYSLQTYKNKNYFIAVYTGKKSNGDSYKPQDNVVAKTKKEAKANAAENINNGLTTTSEGANLGDEPTTNVLLAEIYYSAFGNGHDTIKEGSISYNNIRKYPAVTDGILTGADNYKHNETMKSYYGETTRGAYIPNQLSMAASNTESGNTLANILKIYAAWGWIAVDSSQTDKNNTDNFSWSAMFDEFFNFGTRGYMSLGANIILLILSPILGLLGSLASFINGLLNTLISMVFYVVDVIGNPVFSILGVGSNGETTQETSWATQVVDSIKTTLLSDSNVATAASWIGKILEMMPYVLGISAGFVLLLKMLFRKKGYLRGFSNAFFRSTSWLFLIAVYMAFNQSTPTGQDVSANASDAVSSTSISLRAFALSDNLNLQVAYSDGDKWKEVLGADTNVGDASDWSLTSEQIEALNNKIKDKLGSELYSEITSDTKTTYGPDQYLSDIAYVASSNLPNKYAIASMQTPWGAYDGTSATALKSGYGWYPITKADKSIEYGINAVGAPMLKVDGDGDRQSSDLLPAGYKFNGYLYIFAKNNGSSTQDEADDDGEANNYAYMTGHKPTSDNIAKGLGVKYYSIGYNDSYYTSNKVSLSKPWTYLYGANPNNNKVTEDPTTFNFGTTGNYQIGNLYNSVEQWDSLTDEDKNAKDVDKSVVSPSKQAEEGKKPDVVYYWKYANAYTLALVNKYQGTNSLSRDSLQLSNQSVLFLLQSNLGQNDVEYLASNLNYSDSGKGKSSAKTPYIYHNDIVPQETDTAGTERINGAFTIIALTIVLFCFLKNILSMAIGVYTVGRLVAFIKGIFGSWSNALYFNVLMFLWRLIALYAPASLNWGQEILTKAEQSVGSAVGVGGGFTIGAVALVVAILISHPFGQRKASVVTIFLYGIDSVRVGAEKLLFGRFGLDNFLFGSQSPLASISLADGAGMVGAVRTAFDRGRAGVDKANDKVDEFKKNVIDEEETLADKYGSNTPSKSTGSDDQTKSSALPRSNKRDADNAKKDWKERSKDYGQGTAGKFGKFGKVAEKAGVYTRAGVKTFGLSGPVGLVTKMVKGYAAPVMLGAKGVKFLRDKYANQPEVPSTDGITRRSDAGADVGDQGEKANSPEATKALAESKEAVRESPEEQYRKRYADAKKALEEKQKPERKSSPARRGYIGTSKKGGGNTRHTRRAKLNPNQKDYGRTLEE